MNNIKALRKELGLTQAEFAKKINMSRANLASVETERVNLTERTLQDICREFKVNREWLLNGTGDKFINLNMSDNIEGIVKSIIGNDFLKEMVMTLLQLPDNEKKVVCKMINGLK